MAKNSYDVSRDVVMARPMVLSFGELQVAVCVRRMDQEDGTQGQPRICVNTCYTAKKASKRMAWILGEGAPELRHPEEGDLVLGSTLKRLDPAIAAQVFPQAAKYAEAVAARLAA